MAEESNNDEIASEKKEKQPPKKRGKKAQTPKKEKKEVVEPTSKKEESKQKEEEKVGSADEGEDKPKRKAKGSKKSKKFDHPRTIDMILEALENLEEKQGASVQAIKAFIVDNYKVREDMIKSMIKRALAAALKDNLISRPKNQENKTQLLSGRYILCVKKEENKEPPKPRPSKLRQFTKSANKQGATNKKKKKKRKGYY